MAVDADVPADAAFWDGTELEAAEPLRVRLEVEEMAGDIAVRGTLEGEFRVSCRRCLSETYVPLEDSVVWTFRAGIEDADAEDGEAVFPLPESGRVLDLQGPVREQVLLTVPRFALCREECRGLCPQCGRDLNTGDCDCESEDVDDRWAPLRNLKSE